MNMLGLWHWLLTWVNHIRWKTELSPATVHRGLEVSGTDFGLFPSLLLPDVNRKTPSSQQKKCFNGHTIKYSWDMYGYVIIYLYIHRY